MERRMFARLEHGRSVQNDTACRRDDYLKGDDLTIGHDALPTQAGALPSSQPPTPDKAVSVITLCGVSDPISLDSLTFLDSRPGPCHWSRTANRKRRNYSIQASLECVD